jgi:hypothetical protein
MAGGDPKEVSFSGTVRTDSPTPSPTAALRGTSSYAYFASKKNPKVGGGAKPDFHISTYVKPDGSPQASPVKSPLEPEPPASPGNASLVGLSAGKKAATKAVDFLHRRPREARSMAETLNPVERDGLVENIYELLRVASARDAHNRFTALRLPDTIIIRNGLIYKWYFTSKNGGVMRKNRSRLHREEVRDALLKKGARNVSKIVAVYLTSTSARVKAGTHPDEDENPRDAQPRSPTTPGRPQDIKTHTPLVHCDYLDAEQLRLFLDDDVLSRNGILQAFVEPSTDRMTTIEATFSPATTLLERRVNVNKMDDHRFPAVERMVTFDGADHYSDIVPVQRPQTITALKEGCLAIKDHIAGVGPFYLDVGRMVLYLREDSKRQLWLLWCTSFRCTPRPDDPKVTNFGPLTLHTRMTVDRSGENGSTRRREKAAGVGSTNLEEKSRVPTTGVVVQDPVDGQREWGPEIATEEQSKEEADKGDRRHLVYNIPPVGLLDVLFEPGVLTGGKPDGYRIKDRDDMTDGAAADAAAAAARKQKKDKASADAAGSGPVTKITASEKHRSTRLTKGMELASGELYDDALLICQTAPDLESLKTTQQRQSERLAAAKTLWGVADEKAREREAVVNQKLAEQAEKKKAEQNTYNVRMLKRHRGVDGVDTEISLNLEDLAPSGPLDGAEQSPYGEGVGMLTVQIPENEEGQDKRAQETPKGDDAAAEGEEEDPMARQRNEVLRQLGYTEQVSPGEVDEELQRQLEMLRGLPRNHPTMLEFVRKQRLRISKGENLIIDTQESEKKAAERKARITRSSMGRTGMEMPSPKVSKSQLLEVTRRHTNKLPRRAPDLNRPGSAPVTSSAAAALEKLGAKPALASDDTRNGANSSRRRVRPVSANVSATTAARWGVKAGMAMVDEAAAVQEVSDRHAKAIQAVEDAVPKPQRPLWKQRDSVASTSGAGGIKPLSQMRARSAGAVKPGTEASQSQRVPVPPAASKPRPESAPAPSSSGRITTTAGGGGTGGVNEIAERRRAASEEKYRQLMGYNDKLRLPSSDKENDDAAAAAAPSTGQQQRKAVGRPGSAAPRGGSARPSSAAMAPRRGLSGGAGTVRPSSARPISSAFGDSAPVAPEGGGGGGGGLGGRRRPVDGKRRVQSARVRGRSATATANNDGEYGGRIVRARPQSALVPGKSASPRRGAQKLGADTWLKNVLAETQSLISSVKKEQELYTAEADKLEGQLYERTGMNAAAYHTVRLPPRQ